MYLILNLWFGDKLALRFLSFLLLPRNFPNTNVKEGLFRKNFLMRYQLDKEMSKRYEQTLCQHSNPFPLFGYFPSVKPSPQRSQKG